MITESEETRIDVIYENHIKLCIEVCSKVSTIDNKIMVQLIAIGLGSVMYFYIIFIVIPSEIDYLLFFLWFFSVLFYFVLFFPLYIIVRWENIEREELKKVGFKVEEIDIFSLPRDKDYCKSLWKDEANFTMEYLKYLAMKSKINEHEFRNFLHCPDRGIQLKESDKDELAEIFRRVKERVKNKDVSGECKTDLTPWEFFKNYFYNWWRERKDDEYIDKKVEIIYEEVLKYFREFEEAPRISGGLVVQFENFLDDNKKIIPVSKYKVMELIEAWRVFKLEERY